MASVLSRSRRSVDACPRRGNTSSANVVAAAIKVALAVDIIAASAAATTNPRIPLGSVRVDDAHERHVGIRERRQKRFRSHSDQRTADAIQHAIRGCRRAGEPRDIRASRREYALPDVLADHDAEEIVQRESEEHWQPQRRQREV
jgi:hypothetical protein